MEMEQVIHLRLVDDVPDLEFADADGLGMVMCFAVDLPVDATAQAHAHLEVDGPVWRHISGDERFDRPEGVRDLRV
jgi:hypothetical protein